MKTLSPIITVVVFLFSCTALFGVHTEALNKSELENLTVNKFLDMKYKTYKKLLPHKATLKDRADHFMLKKYLNFQLNNNSISGEKDFSTAADGFNFKFGAFLWGLFFGIFGLIIVALFFRRPKKNALISCLIGLLLWGTIVGILY